MEFVSGMHELVTDLTCNPSFKETTASTHEFVFVSTEFVFSERTHYYSYLSK
jgi:hypothetical protein